MARFARAVAVGCAHHITQPGNNATIRYSYDVGNKRIWRGDSAASLDELDFWAGNQKLATYQISTDFSGFYLALKTTNVYFGGTLVSKGSYSTSCSCTDLIALAPVMQDRLGSVGKFYPYGQERPSATTNDTEKFTGYFRDQATGLDYADQRYHQSGVGRFMTPDPYGGSAKAADPGSWDRYAYVGGDPVNRIDPTGLDGFFQYVTFAVYGNDPGSSGSSSWDCAFSGICGGGYSGFEGIGSEPAGIAPPPQVPCVAGNVTNQLTPAQTALLGGKALSSLTTAQQVMFFTVTTAAEQLGLDLSGFALSSITVAGSGGSRQTELNLTGTVAADNTLTASAPFQSNFESAGWDPAHGQGVTGNYRQTVPNNSMQIVSYATGNLQIDIDPNNPSLFGGSDVVSSMGHIGNFIGNTLTGRDSNYNSIARQLGITINISKCP